MAITAPGVGKAAIVLLGYDRADHDGLFLARAHEVLRRDVTSHVNCSERRWELGAVATSYDDYCDAVRDAELLRGPGGGVARGATLDPKKPPGNTFKDLMTTRGSPSGPILARTSWRLHAQVGASLGRSASAGR
ncbi:MAG: hypothetical protein M1826_001892 [Phylliscum demangeonii]|nr:MAG: hypothetical protein M1826_001892 [Phylliscum demangeonii]